MKLEIGGGLLCQPGYENLDPVHGSRPEFMRKAQSNAEDVPWTWPIGSASVEHIRASHVMEHIPSGADRIFVMNEAYRVLMPGHEFYIEVPILIKMDRSPTSWEAIADPTHVSYWCHESFLYFVRDSAYAAHADYGIQFWDMPSYEEVGSIAKAVLVKP